VICRYVICRYVICRYVICRYVICRYVICRYVICRYVICRYRICRWSRNNGNISFFSMIPDMRYDVDSCGFRNFCRKYRFRSFIIQLRDNSSHCPAIQQWCQRKYSRSADTTVNDCEGWKWRFIYWRNPGSDFWWSKHNKHTNKRWCYCSHWRRCRRTYFIYW